MRIPKGDHLLVCGSYIPFSRYVKVKRPLESPDCRWKDSIKMGGKETSYVCMGWFHLAP